MNVFTVKFTVIDLIFTVFGHYNRIYFYTISVIYCKLIVFLQYYSHHNSERVWFHCDFIYFHFVTNTNKA